MHSPTSLRSVRGTMIVAHFKTRPILRRAWQRIDRSTFMHVELILVFGTDCERTVMQSLWKAVVFYVQLVSRRFILRG